MTFNIHLKNSLLANGELVVTSRSVVNYGAFVRAMVFLKSFAEERLEFSGEETMLFAANAEPDMDGRFKARAKERQTPRLIIVAFGSAFYDARTLKSE